ncbi:MAG TPA: LytTR family transcriptional regulator DNA-binding domain-containing protein [Sunxiuqinia sp.]|nr:LytTR family transcriptional regulator DNA-binding domain-containing protein [Sunxiuqinia sp.]
MNLLVDLLKENLRLFLSITLGLFLFVLFFQPFPIDQFEFNNRLLFLVGLVAIIFVFLVLVRVVFHSVISKSDYLNDESFLVTYISSILILVLSAVAMAFYLRYVGHVSITFYIMFKVVFICLVPPVALKIYDEFQKLNKQNELLKSEKKTILSKIEQYKEDYQNRTVEFSSDYKEDNFRLLIGDVALIKSADNYVEIIFRDGNTYNRKLIRNTLKNIEHQIKPYSNFVRCHRTSIVNTYFVEKLSRKLNNHFLIIRGYQEPIPVSRQYLFKFKEILA